MRFGDFAGVGGEVGGEGAGGGDERDESVSAVPSESLDRGGGGW